MNRIWDPENKYTNGVIEEYQFWVAEVSYRQHTLGAYIIFAKGDIQRFSDLQMDQLCELTVVMKDIEGRLETLFQPDLYNYMQLGNHIRHLHFHGIPRYKEKRMFEDKSWMDENFGHPPIWSTIEEDESYVNVLRNVLIKVGS